MSDYDERLHALEKQLIDLAERMTVLEGSRAGDVVEPSAKSGEEVKEATAGFSEMLKDRLPLSDGKQEESGIVAYAGAIRTARGELLWDFERTTQELFASDMELYAQMLAALGSAVRLELVRLLLREPLTSQQLQERLGISTGPLYYHLKELMAVGIITQPSRNMYQVAKHRVVPFLAILVAVMDLRA